MANREVALTFDDGPNPPFTNQILEILDHYSAPATFFVCGANLVRNDKNRQVIRQAVKAGYLIGNHTFHHKAFYFRVGELLSEVLRTQRLIERLSGRGKKLFRMPNFPVHRLTRKYLESRGFVVPPVGIMGFDWDPRNSPEMIVKRVIDGVTGKTKQPTPLFRVLNSIYPLVTGIDFDDLFSRQVILLHDGLGTNPAADRSRTVAALPEIIKRLQVKGYKFVSLDKVLKAR